MSTYTPSKTLRLTQPLGDDGRYLTLYTPQISTAEARTHGYGCTRNVWLVWHRGGFKTLNSPHLKRQYIGTARFDYGQIRGASHKLMEEAYTEFRDILGGRGK